MQPEFADDPPFATAIIIPIMIFRKYLSFTKLCLAQPCIECTFLATLVYITDIIDTLGETFSI